MTVRRILHVSGYLDQPSPDGAVSVVVKMPPRNKSVIFISEVDLYLDAGVVLAWPGVLLSVIASVTAIPKGSETLPSDKGYVTGWYDVYRPTANYLQAYKNKVMPFGYVLPGNELEVFFSTNNTAQFNRLFYRVFYGYSAATELELLQGLFL